MRGSLSIIINQFKSSVTRWANNNHHGYFVWQGRFYEKIIRSEKEFLNIRKYIHENPLKWNDDEYYKV